MNFAFATASSIAFGAGAAARIPILLPKGSGPVFLVTGATPQRHQSIIDTLEAEGFELCVHRIVGEPSVFSINEALDSARRLKAGCVVAIGGGSVIDAGKAVAALFRESGETLDFLEIAGKGRPLSADPLPFMAVPTTAGTGSEATRNSVVAVPDAGVKVSLRSRSMLPRWAVVDPELTYSLPREVAAYTGMDALIQCLEVYLSSAANPLTDGIAREGLRLAGRSLRGACSEHLNKSAKADLCAASLCSGIALANAKLGSIHGFAGPIGGMISAPHGAICASLLVECFQANLRALSIRAPQHPSLVKMQDIAQLLTGNPEAKASYALAWLDTLRQELPLPRLGQLGLTADRIGEAARKAAQSSSMRGNPIELSRHELEEILEDAL